MDPNKIAKLGVKFSNIGSGFENLYGDILTYPQMKNPELQKEHLERLKASVEEAVAEFNRLMKE